jgi:cell division protease FtsH
MVFFNKIKNCLNKILRKLSGIAFKEKYEPNKHLLPKISYSFWYSKIIENTIQEIILAYTLKLSPVRILLHGPTGTGKTSIATKIAKKLKLPLMPCLAASDLISPFIGASAQKIKLFFGNIIKKHSKEGCVFLIDEIDAIAIDRSREALGDSRNVLLSLLSQIDLLPNSILLVCTTNAPLKTLDPAFLRKGRMSHILNTRNTNSLISKNILQSAWDYEIPTNQRDYEYIKTTIQDLSKEIAFLGLSPAHLHDAVKSVKVQVASLLTRIPQSHDHKYLAKQYTMLVQRGALARLGIRYLSNALITSAPALSSMELADTHQKKWDRVAIAHHEAGHAIVGHILYMKPKLLTINIVGGGVTVFYQDIAMKRITKRGILRMIICAFGGRSGEQIFTREHSLSVISDFSQIKEAIHAYIGLALNSKKVLQYEDTQWVNYETGKAVIPSISSKEHIRIFNIVISAAQRLSESIIKKWRVNFNALVVKALSSRFVTSNEIAKILAI